MVFIGTVEKHNEDRVLDIMEDMLETKTKSWYRSLGGTELKIEEGNIYEGCQLEKRISMSYKVFQHLTNTF